jgi:plastocyanin
VITQPAKVFFPITALAVLAAVLYAIITGDHAGVTLFLGVAGAALLGGLAVTVARENEVAPAVAEDAGPPQLRAARPVRLPGGPGWPAFGAVAAGLIAASFVAGPALAVPGAILALVAAVGWLGSTAADRTGRNVNLMPLGLPVFGLFAIGSLMFLMSRILLAVPEQASTFVALGVAAAILAIASFVALKPSIPPRTIMAGLVIGGVLMTGGGLAAAAVGQRSVEKKESGPKPVKLDAKGIKFDLPEFNLPADQPAVIDFHNGDPVPHNVAIYANKDYAGLPLFQGGVVVGPGSTEYRFTAPGPGTYYFRCDIHPTVMTGTVVVG